MASKQSRRPKIGLAFNSVCTLYGSRRVAIESLTGSSTPHVYEVRPRKDHHLKILLLALLLAAVSHARAIAADVTVPFELRWYMLSMPRPTYPVEARQRRITSKES